MNDPKGKKWTREELILAINLYCKIPFGSIHINNPAIIDLAKKLGRTPGSISYKLANFASIDPSLPRKGAAHTSKLDREVWEEFFESWESMAFKSEEMLAQKEQTNLFDKIETDEIQVLKDGNEREASIKIRVNQNFFRKMVLASYNNTCCITGLTIPELLNAGHIVPWSVDTKNRLNPRNGLCLNALHDRAFDRGLITISDDFKVIVSDKCPSHDLIKKYNTIKIKLPNRFLPDKSFLQYHRKNVFVG